MDLQFPSESKTLNLEEMNALCEALDAAEEDYKEKKKISDNADKEKKKIRQNIIDALEASGLKSFKSNAGTVTVVEKLSYATPKTLEEKAAFFDYITEKYGQDSADGLRTVNSRSLNSFLNESGEISVPGIAAPVGNNTLSFRRS